MMNVPSNDDFDFESFAMGEKSGFNKGQSSGYAEGVTDGIAQGILQEKAKIITPFAYGMFGSPYGTNADSLTINLSSIIMPYVLICLTYREEFTEETENEIRDLIVDTSQLTSGGITQYTSLIYAAKADLPEDNLVINFGNSNRVGATVWEFDEDVTFTRVNSVTFNQYTGNSYTTVNPTLFTCSGVATGLASTSVLVLPYSDNAILNWQRIHDSQNEMTGGFRFFSGFIPVKGNSYTDTVIRMNCLGSYSSDPVMNFVRYTVAKAG